MSLIIQQISEPDLPQYATVSIAFEVKTIFQIHPINEGIGGLELCEEPVDPPYIKNYDADAGNSPTDWTTQFDIQTWGIFLATQNAQPIAGAAVAMNTRGANELEDRDDQAFLWDIRVHPDHRGQGIGKQIFAHAANWAKQQGCTQLKVETQNINVSACRFYVRQGCHLGSINIYGYASSPSVQHETMLLWYLNL